jgi:predicted ATPase
LVLQQQKDPVRNNWYVVTGGPSTGKTTLLKILESKGHMIFPELARAVIDEGMAKGLSIEQIREDEKKFQLEVLKRKQLVEANHKPAILTFFDRGMHDTIAYMRSYGWKIEKEVLEEINKADYRKVFLLDALPKYEKDYARTEGGEFTNKINQLLQEAYEKAGIEVVRVKYDKPEKRAAFILDRID